MLGLVVLRDALDAVTQLIGDPAPESAERRVGAVIFEVVIKRFQERAHYVTGGAPYMLVFWQTNQPIKRIPKPLLFELVKTAAFKGIRVVAALVLFDFDVSPSVQKLGSGGNPL